MSNGLTQHQRKENQEKSHYGIDFQGGGARRLSRRWRVVVVIREIRYNWVRR